VVINYGIPVTGTTTLHVAVGERKGFFEREGLQLDVLMTQSVPLIAQGLQGGSLEVGGLGPDVAMLAIEKGADIGYVAGIHQNADWRLLAQPTVGGYADLKDQQLGVATLKGGSATVFRRMLRQNGLRDDEIQFVQTGGTAGRIAALESNVIAAALIATPRDVVLMRKGYRALGHVADSMPAYALNSLAVARSWASANDDVLLRVVRAHVASVDWLNDPANRAEGIALLADYTNVPQDVAAEVYDNTVGTLKLWTPRARFNLDAYRAAIDIMIEDGDLAAPGPDPRKYLDTRYLERLGIDNPIQ
jgi:NitT/TauT family transport system substrate-binding protein